MNLLYGYRLEKAHSTINDLRTQLSYAENKLGQLQNKEVPPKELVVENIKPFLSYDGHKIELSSLEEYIIDSVGHLIGRPVESVDLELVVRVFDRRILTFNSNRCQLRVRYLLLSETLGIYIDVSDLPPA
ncbi:MAG: hypothetical protein WCS98_05785 [Bacillota bacterium]|nr:hypothetical protein [Bacillota bacterium]MDD3298112.1 hypothetical protein [Bacillota bacterium]MDD3851147.1 hypothetical protein [Bacillota bacterium]MDD4707435.1 hypothetical protein [Bacillota bacterium]